MKCRSLMLAVAVGASLAALVPLAADAAPAHPAFRSQPQPARAADLHAEGRTRQGQLWVRAWGFQPGERVQVRELERPGWQQLVTADRHGQLTVRIETAGRSRHDVLTFVGLGAGDRAARGGTVTVAVPRIAVYRFS